MPGYYNRPDLTAQAIVDSWPHTGDLGHADQEGFLYLADRKKDMIISRCTSVFPVVGRKSRSCWSRGLCAQERRAAKAPQPSARKQLWTRRPTI